MSRWTASDIPSQTGRLAIVTGPTGLGYEVGLALARAGAEVILAGRNAATAQVAVDRVRAAVPNAKVRFEALDLASLVSVRAFASRMIEAGRPVDLLINNAGVMMPPRRQLTADGFELQFGTNYLGHFVLTADLLPLLRRAPSSRVVSVSSIAAINGQIQFGNLQFDGNYRPSPAYAQSKLAMLMFALELQRQSEAHEWGVTSIGAHPGVAATDLISKGPGSSSALGIISAMLPFVRQPVAQGALPILFAATSPAAMGGGYYGPDGFQEIRGYPRPARIVLQARDTASAERLWSVSEQLGDVRFGELTAA
jgi:NAD(P)-dependent dehydrogenase (short-subunit alcohol dehydrogenase family)